MARRLWGILGKLALLSSPIPTPGIFVQISSYLPNNRSSFFLASHYLRRDLPVRQTSDRRSWRLLDAKRYLLAVCACFCLRPKYAAFMRPCLHYHSASLWLRTLLPCRLLPTGKLRWLGGAFHRFRVLAGWRVAETGTTATLQWPFSASSTEYFALLATALHQVLDRISANVMIIGSGKKSMTRNEAHSFSNLGHSTIRPLLPSHMSCCHRLETIMRVSLDR